MSRYTSRKALTVVAATAVAGSALFVGGVAQAATPSAQGKLNLLAIETSKTGVVALVTGTGFKNANGTSNLAAAGSAGIVAATASCAATSTPSATVGDVTAVSTVSATAATVTLSAPTAAGAFKLCVRTTGASYVSAPLAVAAAFAVDSSSKGVFPASGPTAGGQSVVVTAASGTAFRKDSSVTIGGKPASKVTVAADGSSLTAVTAPLAADSTGAVVTVSAPGFTAKSSDATNGLYKVINTIKVSPSLAQAGDTLTITGQGFSAATSFVALTADGGVTSVATADGGCDNVQVVSSTVLTCDLTAATNNGAFTVAVDDTAIASATALNAPTAPSSLATLTVADF